MNRFVLTIALLARSRRDRRSGVGRLERAHQAIARHGLDTLTGRTRRAQPFAGETRKRAGRRPLRPSIREPEKKKKKNQFTASTTPRSKHARLHADRLGTGTEFVRQRPRLEVPRATTRSQPRSCAEVKWCPARPAAVLPRRRHARPRFYRSTERLPAESAPPPPRKGGHAPSRPRVTSPHAAATPDWHKRPYARTFRPTFAGRARAMTTVLPGHPSHRRAGVRVAAATGGVDDLRDAAPMRSAFPARAPRSRGSEDVADLFVRCGARPRNRRARLARDLDGRSRATVPSSPARDPHAPRAPMNSPNKQAPPLAPCMRRPSRQARLYDASNSWIRSASNHPHCLLRQRHYEELARARFPIGRSRSVIRGGLQNSSVPGTITPPSTPRARRAP